MCALMFQLRQNVEGRQAFRQHIRNKCLLQSIISFVRKISIYSLKPSYFQENNLCFYFQQFILTNILTFGLAYPHDGFEAETKSFTITPKNFTIDMIEPRQSGSCATIPSWMRNSPLRTIEEPSNDRIVGGSSAPSMIPWQVSVRKYGNHFCGGTILDSRTILSAAHCFTKGSVANFHQLG